jgi:hypothetical protein
MKPSPQDSERLIDVMAVLAIVIGAWLRLRMATTTYLNPDEAVFYFMGSTQTLGGVFDEILRLDHAPLPIVLVHVVQRISSSELALRFVPLVAGILFPWVVYRWLGAAWSRTAGLIALVALTFSPALVSLSAQVRGYTILLLIAAVGLRLLDSGIAARSGARIFASTMCGALAVLTEFSGAFYIGGAAVYFLARVRDLPRRLVVLWALGQAVVLVICIVLYLKIAAPNLTNHTVTGLSKVFTGAYRQPGQNLAMFLAASTVRQFSFLFGSHVVGALMTPLFVVAMTGLWIKRRHALAVLLAGTILFAWAGALFSHPFGRSRHTAILALVIASGVAIGIELILRRRALLVAPALAILMPLTGWPDDGDIHLVRYRRDSMFAAIRYLQANVPPDGVVLADRETSLILQYYLRDEPHLLSTWLTWPEARFGDLHVVVVPGWDFGDADTFAADLDRLRRLLGKESSKPIWVADGGFTTSLRTNLRRRYPQLALPGASSFDGAVEVFRLPPEL